MAPPTLLTLPGELRNRIYEYAFAPSPKILVVRGNQNNTLRTRRYGGHRGLPNLLLANKQTYKEALPILYESCIFCITSSKTAKIFFNHLNFTLWLDRIQHLKISYTLNGEGGSDASRQAKQVSDLVFIRCCEDVAKNPPNLKSPELDLNLQLSLQALVPLNLSEPWLYDCKDPLRLMWIKAVKHFATIKNLRNIEVNVQGDYTLTPCFKPKRFADPTLRWMLERDGLSVARNNNIKLICREWRDWYDRLRGSIAEVTRSIALGQNAAEAWGSHLQLCEQYA